MKYVSTLILLLLALPSGATPRLVCAQPDYDFGRVKGEPMIEHSFTLENKGDSPLVIRRVVTSCGCTTSKTRSFEIPPGDSKDLPVEIDLKGRSGPQRQFITLHTNDPNNPRLPLKVTGTAVPPIDIAPRTLNLKQVDPDNLADHAGVITLTSNTDEPFTIEKVDALNNRVQTEWSHAEDSLSATLTLTPLPQKGEGHFTDTLRIHTSHPDVRDKRVLVMWEVRTGVSVAPGVLNLRSLSNAPPQQRYLMVRASPEIQKTLEITDVTWEERDLDIDWKHLPMGWRIHIKDLIVEDRMHGETLRIRTNHPEFEELRVPVRVTR